jgi:hypothetical protein
MLGVAYAECLTYAFYAESNCAECHYAESRYAESRHSECHYAESRYAESRHSECHYAERHGTLILTRR